MAGETVISTGNALTVKLFSVTLMTETEKLSVFSRMMGGKKSTQRMADAKRTRMQTTPDMPIVHITDLTKNAGDKVTCDMRHIIGGKPTMGDKEIEGRGVPLTHSTMEVKINQTRHAVNPGSRMTQKRTRHNLRKAGRAELAAYFARLQDQIIQTHMAGARGTEFTEDWHLPLESDPDFADIMINPMQPPTSNRYFVAGGGENVSEISVTDALKLEDLDVISATLRDMPFPPAPIKIENDPMSEEEPVWCLMVTHRQWHYILSRTGEGTTSWRRFVAEAAKRAMISKHPLFAGTTGLWNGLLVKRMPRAIRFTAGTGVKVVSADDGTTVTTTNVPAGVSVDRAILLGGQALAVAEGDARGGGDSYPSRWSEIRRDHGNSIEIAAGFMDGKEKFRFTGSDGKVTDFGIAVIDSYAPVPKSTAGATLRTALAT